MLNVATNAQRGATPRGRADPLGLVQRTPAFDLVRLTPLMEFTSGHPEVAIGIIDGPVDVGHSSLDAGQIRSVAPGPVACAHTESVACLHGTFVAGILAARRDSAAPGICPGCTLLVRPVFGEASPAAGTTSEALAAAIVETVDAGARVLNLSLAVTRSSPNGARQLGQALDHAVRKGALTVAAAGNQGLVSSSIVTRHPSVIPVAACDAHGRPSELSNLAGSIGRRGLSAPGAGMRSIGDEGRLVALGGTSAATPVVAGTIALLWSIFPRTSAAALRFTVTQAGGPRRSGVVPPLLDAFAAYLRLRRMRWNREQPAQ